MRNTRSGWVRSGCVALSLLASSGCGAVFSDDSDDAAPKAGSKGTVTIGVLPWIGYDANVAVIGRILETKLGYKVVTKPVKAPDMWAAMESGSIDVMLESWSQGALKKTYVEEKKTVVALGPMGNKGVIGWYIPIWMAQQYPDIRYWNNLNKYANLFQTSASGGKGQMLEGDPTYVTNDPALISNLKLNFNVVYAGSEDATVKLALEASKNHTPLLFYFWQPHWLFRQVKLARVSLPPYSAGCDADPKMVTCDYAATILEKLGGKAFVDKGGKALELIKNFKWSNSDQNEVADYLANEKVSQAEAADRWMEAHPDTWEPWIPS